jgi:hypothetical protein
MRLVNQALSARFLPALSRDTVDPSRQPQTAEGDEMRKHAHASFMAALAFMAVSGMAVAQTLGDIELAEEVVIDAWQRTPLAFRTTVIVDAPPQGFGVYHERAHNEFAPGEPIVIYAEPVGYAWRENPDGTYTFGFDVDLLLKKSDGAIVGGQENFQHLELTSRARNREFMLTLTLTVDGAPPGDYVVEYTTRDIASDKAAVISRPFFIVE